MKHSAPSTPPQPRTSWSRRAGRFFVFALTAAVFAAPSAYAQFNSGESQPPPHPKPRFPQLPDDPVNPAPPAPPRPEPEDITTAKELVGHIQKIQDRKITIKHNQSDVTHTVAVSPRAEILLNTEPAALEDLKPTDFVRLRLSQTIPDPVTDRVVAARVVKDTPPQEPLPPRPRTRVPEEPNVRRPVSNEAGLGVTVHDSPNLGVLVVDVHKDTPAWASGLQIGDYLLQIDKKPLESPEDLLNELSRRKPNDKVRLAVWRRGQAKEGVVQLTTDEIAGDRIATNDRVLILGERGNNPVVVQDAKQGVFVDAEPNNTTVVQPQPGPGAVVEQQNAPQPGAVEQQQATPQTELPQDYDKLAEDYRRLLERVNQLERELNRQQRQ